MDAATRIFLYILVTSNQKNKNHVGMSDIQKQLNVSQLIVKKFGCTFFVFFVIVFLLILVPWAKINQHQGRLFAKKYRRTINDTFTTVPFNQIIIL